MPFLLIKTNIPLDKTMRETVLNQASTVIARTTGKPEKFIMVNVCSGEDLLFGAKSAPGLVPVLSKALTEMIESRLQVPGNRIYIEFSSVPGHMWGYNGTTF